MKPLHVLSTVGEVRAVADPRRISILALLCRESLTASQLAERVAQPVGRTHYHLKALERAGLVRQVRTREVRGALEKYYRAVARDFEVSPDLMRGQARRAVADAAQRHLREMYRQARHAVETIAARRPAATRAELRRRYPAAVSGVTVYVTPAELRRLFADVRTAVKRHGGRAARGRRAYTLWTVGHPADPGEP